MPICVMNLSSLERPPSKCNNTDEKKGLERLPENLETLTDTPAARHMIHRNGEELTVVGNLLWVLASKRR